MPYSSSSLSEVELSSSLDSFLAFKAIDQLTKSYRTLEDYSKPSHEGYRNTIELPVGNNVVPLRSDTIRLVQNGCSFHGLRSEDPNQHLKDFLKLVDSLDLDGENRERTPCIYFTFLPIDQASNWLERLPAGSITTWEDLTTRFLAQFFPSGRTAKLRNDILMFQQHHGESLSEAWDAISRTLPSKIPHTLQDLVAPRPKFFDRRQYLDTRRTIDQIGRIRTIYHLAGGKLRDHNAEESWALLEDLALYDNESWNDPRDLTKPYCIENPEQAFLDYASSCANEIGGELVSIHSSSYQIKLKNALLDFNSHQEKRLSHLKTQLEQHQDDIIEKVNLLWKTVSEKLNDTSFPEYARNSMAPKSIAATSHDEKEELRKKGIKSPSKLVSPKYLSSASIKELNKSPSSLKRVHFVNSIVILSTDSDTEEEDVLSTNACNLDLGGMVKGKEWVKEQGKEENEMGTDMEVDEVIEEEESEFETDEEVK
ncbi:MAK10-like protein [Tanacetum coccineum]